jgi:hypothetical protein
MTSKDKEVRDLPERKIPDNKADQVKGGAITPARRSPTGKANPSNDPRSATPTGIAGPPIK